MHTPTVTVTNKIKLWSAAHKVRIHFGILLSSLKVCAIFSSLRLSSSSARARSKALPLISVHSHNRINHSFLAICSHIWMLVNWFMVSVQVCHFPCWKNRCRATTIAITRTEKSIYHFSNGQKRERYSNYRLNIPFGCYCCCLSKWRKKK